mgnify:CR=1 FL=1
MGAAAGRALGRRHLLGREREVDDLEVLREAVADEAAARVGELAELDVRRLHRGDVVRRHRRVQIARVEPREAREIVDDGFGLADVRVDERHARHRPGAAHARDARERDANERER